MKYFLKGLFTMLLLCMSVSVLSVQIEFHSFENTQKERLYLDLIAELRCVKCQNQNLAESNAELARDMREKTYQMIVEGKSREDVVNYMTARYGDFVLYRPPLKSKTLLLWAGPPLLLFLSVYFLLKVVRRQQAKTVDTYNDSDLDSVRELLKPNSNREK